MSIKIPSGDCAFCANMRCVPPRTGPVATVMRDDNGYAIMAPAALGRMPGHVLAYPTRHVETIFDLTDDECARLLRLVRDVAAAVRDAFQPAGIHVQQRNGLAGWQTVPHVHFHIIPVMRHEDWPPSGWIEPLPSDERAEHAATLRDTLIKSNSAYAALA